jgi:DNA-binding LytR/AlgR family response regulator
MHRKGGGFLLKAAICDDEFVTANYYYEQIEQLFQKSDTDIELDMFTDSGKLLARLYDQERWDIYFLDIDMPLVNGLDLGKKIRELDADCYLVYISIHEECVYDSMKTKPFRFIPKNEFASRIEGCIQDIITDLHSESESNFILLETRTALYRYRISDIVYVHSLDKYVTLFLKDNQQTESIRFKLSDVENQLLPHGFIRIHKSYLVNCSFIKSIQPSCIILDNGNSLPVSRYRLEEIKTNFRRLTL